VDNRHTAQNAASHTHYQDQQQQQQHDQHQHQQHQHHDAVPIFARTDSLLSASSSAVTNAQANVVSDAGKQTNEVDEEIFSHANMCLNMRMELKHLALMERCCYRKIPIRVSRLMALRLRQFDLSASQQRLDTIISLISACEYVPHCDSINHRKPAGCPKCGVVHMGGHSTAVQYMRSQDKTSGVFTLVPLEYELENLRKELVTQQETVDGCLHAVEELRSEIANTLIVSLQNWYVVRLAHKRCRRDCIRIDRSLYFHRIRRLVRMKREIDGQLVSSLNVVALGGRYSELTRYVGMHTSMCVIFYCLTWAQRIGRVCCFEDKYRGWRSYENCTPTDIETANSCTQDATEETKERRIARHIAGAHNVIAFMLAEVHVVYVVPGTCFREWLMGTLSSGNELNSCERCGNAWNSWKHASGCAFAQSVRTVNFSQRIGTYCAYMDSTAFRYYCSKKSSLHS
jgi:hypothetical protein